MLDEDKQVTYRQVKETLGLFESKRSSTRDKNLLFLSPTKPDRRLEDSTCEMMPGEAESDKI